MAVWLDTTLSVSRMFVQWLACQNPVPCSCVVLGKSLNLSEPPVS